MSNPEKTVSLLYLSEAVNKPEVVADVMCNPEAVKPTDYYLVMQMPKLEFFGKDPVDLVMEVGVYTGSPEWKSTGRRDIRVGDIVCIGCQAYLTIAEGDVHDDFKPAFKLLSGVTVVAEATTHRIGCVAIPENPTLRNIICSSVCSTKT